jgi:hypothetical protein
MSLLTRARVSGEKKEEQSEESRDKRGAMNRVQKKNQYKIIRDEDRYRRDVAADSRACRWGEGTKREKRAERKERENEERDK